MEDRLKAKLWLDAQIRLCEIQGMFAMVVQKGDIDSGSILIKHNRFSNGCAVYVPVTTLEGTRGWMHGLKEGYGPEREADEFVRRQMSRDPDLWVLEIEDQKNQYELDAPLVQ